MNIDPTTRERFEDAPPPEYTRSVPVDIVGDHPHTGRRGTIEVVNGKVAVVHVMGTPMVRVRFDQWEEAFAEAKHIREVKP